ncbi:hypothetical protein Back2_22250 [Nocardioides baekrokdamisoli]|uniref:mRNA interferase PemK n=1 Tax=Nocardioides baekrokdamisoli TaxID=1804624 RepID=A0A3G9J2V7_9ACTN|nr:type II toxin-antitoxin system PemK/MazF family toxin [Nocardioides baekrokdamisoli]BBH17938.1 hypothetical protein Back2_22250 [Nocardioides baekrokdamisoli]
MWPFKRPSAPTAQIGYAPVPDGRADPGEVCWAWVPFEDDPSRGKDRPVLIVGVEGDLWLALMLTSKDHDREAVEELPNGVAVDHFGHRWLDIGAGAWDREGRPSEVRLDRLLRLSKVRREGAALDEAMFRRVAAAAGISDRR